MSRPVLEYWYDYSCPYAYLASTQVEALARAAGARLEYRPFLLGGVFRSLGDAAPDARPLLPARARVNLQDMHRWAARWKVQLRFPPGHPNRTVTALRATLRSGDVPRATHALFRAYWVEERDVSRPDVVREVLDGAGLDGSAALAAAERADVKDELRRRTEEAIDRGVFGAPALFVDGELSWGQDRLDRVARQLGLPGWDPAAAEATPRAGSLGSPSFSFWFDYSSPFAYLGLSRARLLAAELRARCELRPFLLGGLFRELGTPDVPLLAFAPAKQRWMRRDLQLTARELGVPFRFTTRFPQRSVLALRTTLVALRELGPGREDERWALVEALFRAVWEHDLDVSSPGVVRGALRGVGLPEAWVDRASEARDELRAETTRALSLGVVGAPTFQVADELFWGQDRAALVRSALLAGP